MPSMAASMARNASPTSFGRRSAARSWASSRQSPWGTWSTAATSLSRHRCAGPWPIRFERWPDDLNSTRTYLDHNPSSPLRPEARQAVIAALDAAGNASSVHGEGRAARNLVEAAREQVAAAVAAPPRAVVFTSGGTEANALALCGI